MQHRAAFCDRPARARLREGAGEEVVKGGCNEDIEVRDSRKIEQGLRHCGLRAVSDEAGDRVVDGHARALAFAFEEFAGSIAECHAGLVLDFVLTREVRDDGLNERHRFAAVLNGHQRGADDGKDLAFVDVCE